MAEYIERESIKYKQIETGGYSGNTWITDYELVAYKRDIESIPAADAIEELVGKTDRFRWIPVTEEPPLKVGDDGYNGYLVYANGHYEVADYTTDKFDNVPYFHVDGEYEPDVTHYMPLPKPPKGET